MSDFDPNTAKRFPMPGPTSQRSWQLGDGLVLNITLPSRLTPKNLERLEQYVAALRVEAAIGWDVTTNDDEPDRMEP